MGDDPCQYVNTWNHELAMRRLISLLRQGQAYCTDNECLEELPGSQVGQDADNSFLIMFMTMAFAVAMYMMRPRRNRNQIADAAKPARNSHDNDGAPPTPPRI